MTVALSENVQRLILVRYSLPEKMVGGYSTTFTRFKTIRNDYCHKQTNRGLNMVHSFDWILLKSRHIVKDRWISVRSDTCKMPNGTIVDPYYVLEYPTWVNVVALTKNQEIVLVNQYRYGIKKTGLELPGGSMEAEDISPLEAAKRELLEESGYTSNNFIETAILSPNSASHNNLIHCFLATDVEHVADLKLDVTEQIDVVLLPLEKLVQDIDNGILLQTIHISSLFFALKKLGKVQFS